MHGKVLNGCSIHSLLCAFALIIVFSACSNQSMDADISDVDMSTRGDFEFAAQNVTQNLIFSQLPVIATESAPNALLEVRHLRTGHLHFQTFAAPLDTGPHQLDLSAIGLPVEVTIYLDFNQNSIIDKCEYPPQNQSTIRDATHDLWVGQIEIDRIVDTALAVDFVRSSCAPGASETVRIGLLDVSELEVTNTHTLLLE